MKRFALLLVVVFLLGSATFAQQNLADAPASKADVERYLDVVHTRDLMTTMMDAMSKQVHQMIGEQLKKQGGLTPEAQAQVNKMMDDVIKSIRTDDLLDAMIPVYQKHFTKGNIDDLIAFYSTPTGQKLVKELPAITTEAMQAATPVYQKIMADTLQRLEAQMTQLRKENDASGKKQTQQN